MSKEVIILAGGWSVKEGIAQGLWDKIKDKEIWSLNFAYKFLPYLPSKQFHVDITFFRNCVKELQMLSERGVPIHAKENDIEYVNIKAVQQHKVFRTPKEEKPGELFIGQMGLCGLFALSYAISQGYENIYLLGHDFGSPNLDNKNTHWYQDLQMNEFSEPIKSNGLKNPSVYLERNDAPKPMIKDFEYYLKFPNKIYNVSSRSNINYFPIIGYDEFFRKIEEPNESE